MSILVRRPGDKWRTATGQPYTNETQLQKMLHESPELVPKQGDAQVRAFIRESGLPGSGYTDLIGIDEDGNLYVVECKLITNSEIRRKVVGQILEYAAFLWGMSYDDFDKLFVQREGKTIRELIGAKVPADWSFDIFREAVKQNLETGTFRLLIVVDEMNEELARIIRYITSRGGGVRLEALELKLYREGETEILVPNLHGEQVQPGDKTLQRKQTIEQVVESCENDTTRARLRLLVAQWSELGHKVEPGTSGLSFRATIGPQTHYVFWALDPNTLSARFNGLQERGVPQNLIDEYRKQLAGLPAFDSSKVMTQSAPRARLADLDEQQIAEFVGINQHLVEKWREAAGTV